MGHLIRHNGFMKYIFEGRILITKREGAQEYHIFADIKDIMVLTAPTLKWSTRRWTGKDGFRYKPQPLEHDDEFIWFRFMIVKLN